MELDKNFYWLLNASFQKTSNENLQTMWKLIIEGLLEHDNLKFGNKKRDFEEKNLIFSFFQLVYMK